MIKIILLSAALMFIGFLLFLLMRTLDTNWDGKIKNIFRFKNLEN